MSKMTYVEAVDFAIDLISKDTYLDWNEETRLTYPDEVARLKDLKAQLEKRSKVEHKPTKTQTENVAIKDTICAVLGDADSPMRVKDMIADSRLGDYTTAKISALLRQLLPDTGDGRVVKTVEKKISYFTLA